MQTDLRIQPKNLQEHDSAYIKQHNEAVEAVRDVVTSADMHRTATLRRAAERAIVSAIKAWEAMAIVHLKAYDNTIGNDGYAGDYWAQMGKAILAMLNTETGRLYCGRLDSCIRQIAYNHGVDASQW